MIAYDASERLQHEADVVHPSLQEAVLNTCPVLVQRGSASQWLMAANGCLHRGAGPKKEPAIFRVCVTLMHDMKDHSC